MFSFSLLLALTLNALLAVAQDTSLRKVEQAFKSANIQEDIAISFKPMVLLEVSFPQNTTGPMVLHAGELVPKNTTVFPPSYSLAIPTHHAENVGKGPFVISVVDPDAPTPQNTSVSQVRHFLGGDFFVDEGCALRNATPAVSRFLRPRPQLGSDPHRYIFLLWKQSEAFDTQTLVTPPTSNFYNFNMSQFAHEVGLGEPIGGTFMLVGPDATSPVHN